MIVAKSSKFQKWMMCAQNGDWKNARRWLMIILQNPWLYVFSLSHSKSQNNIENFTFWTDCLMVSFADLIMTTCHWKKQTISSQEENHVSIVKYEKKFTAIFYAHVLFKWFFKNVGDECSQMVSRRVNFLIFFRFPSFSAVFVFLFWLLSFILCQSFLFGLPFLVILVTFSHFFCRLLVTFTAILVIIWSLFGPFYNCLLCQFNWRNRGKI